MIIGSGAFDTILEANAAARGIDSGQQPKAVSRQAISYQLSASASRQTAIPMN
jgi:hypothetical protein